MLNFKNHYSQNQSFSPVTSILIPEAKPQALVRILLSLEGAGLPTLDLQRDLFILILSNPGQAPCPTGTRTMPCVKRGTLCPHTGTWNHEHSSNPPSPETYPGLRKTRSGDPARCVPAEKAAAQGPPGPEATCHTSQRPAPGHTPGFVPNG